ncbi:MAG: hypothetical protein ABEJ04_07630 [Halobacteriaceae archaeon]
MDAQRAAVGVALVVAVLAGCSGAPVSDAPGQPFTTISAAGCSDEFAGQPPPAPNATTATAFALACETSRLVEPDHYEYRTAAVLAHSESGFYVSASVLVGTETGGTSGVYFVGNGTYTRLVPDHQPVDSYFHSEDPAENTAQDAYLLNFGDESRSLRLSLTYLDESQSETVVFDRTYALAGDSGAEATPVTMRIGEYDATLSEDGELLATKRYTLSEEQSGDLVVVIEPDGDPLITRTEEGDA